MPCMRCAHPTCKHGFARLGVMACPECEVGSVVLDAVSFPKWRLDCSHCNYLVYLPPDLHSVKVTPDSCEVRTLRRLRSCICMWANPLVHSTAMLAACSIQEAYFFDC